MGDAAKPMHRPEARHPARNGTAQVLIPQTTTTYVGRSSCCAGRTAAVSATVRVESASLLSVHGRMHAPRMAVVSAFIYFMREAWQEQQPSQLFR